MHEGHRSRLLDKIIKSDKLYDHELMEALLFNARPRKDVNAEAHRLLQRFNDIEGVLSANVEQLKGVEGVGENMAQYLSILGKCLARCHDAFGFATIKSTREFLAFMSTRTSTDTDRLDFHILDKDGRVKRICSVHARKGERATVNPGQLVKGMSVYGAYGIFVAYVRAEGNSTPCEEDDNLLSEISGSCVLCSTRLYDFCVFSQRSAPYSFFLNDRAEFSFGGELIGR